MLEFSKPKSWTETHGLDSPPYEKFSACPYCGEYDYVEIIKRCDSCDEPIIDYSYIKLKDGTDVCEKCYEVMCGE